MKKQSQKLLDLKDIWLVPKNKRKTDGREVARLDESFHLALVSAAANKEIERVHAELTEKIRIIRRLDFTEDTRIEATYREHAKILRSLLQRKFPDVSKLLCLHIEQSKFEVRKITLHRLHEAQVRNCHI
jgi:DNA-binding GntR family transcriptional regulator